MIDTVKIGALTYSVKEVADLHSVGDDGKKVNLHGQIEWKLAEIRIAPQQAHDVQVVTLWHEILHGILNNAGHFDESENMIVAISHGLVQVMRENGELVRWTAQYE